MGSYEGWFTQCWLHCYPNASVIALEPSDDAMRNYPQPKLGASRKIEVIQEACGARDETRTLRLLECPGPSSLLELGDDAGLEVAQIGEQQVKVNILGDFLRERGITEIMLVRIDAQGMNVEVLDGLDGVLERIRYLCVEASICPVYRTSAAFASVIVFLEQRGFRMLGIQATTLATRYVRVCDMLFGCADGTARLIEAAR